MAYARDDVLAMLRAPLVYRVAGMDAVTVRRGIAYRGAATEGEKTRVRVGGQRRQSG